MRVGVIKLPRSWVPRTNVSFGRHIDRHAGGSEQTSADKTPSRSTILRWRRTSADVHRVPTSRLLISRFSVRVRGGSLTSESELREAAFRRLFAFSLVVEERLILSVERLI